jgi:hypothetical protein
VSGLDNRLHWRKRFGPGKGAKELKLFLEACGTGRFASSAMNFIDFSRKVIEF